MAIAGFKENVEFVAIEDYATLCDIYGHALIERMRNSKINYCGIYGPSCEREEHVLRLFKESLQKQIARLQAELAEIKGY